MQKIKSKCLKPNCKDWRLFKTHLLLIVILFWVSIPCSGQDFFPKWGDFSDDEITIEFCEFEPEAGAVILGDYGKMTINNAGFIELVRRKRIKILTDLEKGPADQTISYFSKDGLENVKKIRAQTINFIDGKKEVVKVEKSSIFDVDVSENWREVRITFPSVTAGSIIELEYTKFSKNYVYLDNWYFQTKYPTLSSIFEAKIPSEPVSYNVFTQGPITKPKYAGQSTNKWELTNIPSYYEEPFCHNPQDFVEAIKFQAASYYKRSHARVQYTTSVQVSFAESWNDFVDRVLETRFKNYISETILNRMGLPEFDRELPQKELISKMYQYVQTNLNWNGEFSAWATQKPKDLIESKNGNVAEINLFLILWLKNYGIEAYPIISSTKSNGQVNEYFPLLSQYNNVLGVAYIDNEEILFTAIDPLTPLKFLTKNDLNNRGYMIEKLKHKWIDLDPKPPTKTVGITNIEMNKNAELLAESSLAFYGYDGIEKRRKIITQLNNKNSLGEILKTLFDFDQNTTFDSLQLINLYDIDEPLKIYFKGKFPVNRIQDNVYEMVPFLFQYFKENPFVSEKRNLPIDLNASTNSTLIYNYTFPSEATLDAVPENQTFSLPNRKGIFGFSLLEGENQIQISIQIQQSAYFTPQEYPYLREYRSMISKILTSPMLIKLSSPSENNQGD